MKPLADCRLYAFVDTAWLQGRAPEVVAQQLCDGGADLIQLRAKKSSPDEICRMAEAILPITQPRQRRPGHQRSSGTLPATSARNFAIWARKTFLTRVTTHCSELRTPKSEVRIGLSTHSPEQAKRALAAGADYLAIGPVYATGTKPTAKPVTLEYVRWAAANVNVPWFAIGGITLENLGDVLAAGAQRVCVVSAILNAPDVAKACAEFRRRLA